MADLITYDIRQFSWVKKNATFYGEAPHLVGFLPDDTAHPEAFPSGKKQFIIKNYDTGGFRRFRLVEETDLMYFFESDDGIKCNIYLGFEVCPEYDEATEEFYAEI